ncbi:CopD family protein [Nitratireductor sp. CH_MIT9313-5]|uniref:CopD family protein n=1 Tax=Nitratireductor sp. CH_MIT9313-5 TaxID=3107764 RepID=UPI00300A4A64
MITSLPGFITLLKIIHITALVLWCGGLMAMPLMLTRHDPAIAAEEYERIRRASHRAYVGMVTPAALLAIIAGTWLIFFREVFVTWLYAKLLFVAALVAAHAWVGHIVVQIAEQPEDYEPPRPTVPLLLILFPILFILLLVLGKPELEWVRLPDWVQEPRGYELPFEVPKR